jgi:transmembrane sensor
MNTNPNHSMDDLLVKCILDEALPAERDEVDKWRAQHPENEKYYNHFKLIWQQSRELASASDVNEEEAWERFKKRTAENERPVIELNSNRPNYLFRIAAAIVVMAGVGWAVYFSMFRNRPEELVTVKAGAEALVDTLPDGSVVTLNRRSSISYPEGFAHGASRPVTLRGEAFFDVQPDKSKPFVITVNDVTVTVVGTSFNIKSNESSTEVIVETGLVEVEKSTEMVKLHPQEKVIVHKEKNKLEKELSGDELYKYYRTGKLVCNDIPLSEVISKLNEVYNTRIIIENKKLADQKFNTTLELKSLSADLHVIRETFSCTIHQDGDTLILK